MPIMSQLIIKDIEKTNEDQNKSLANEEVNNKHNIFPGKIFIL